MMEKDRPIDKRHLLLLVSFILLFIWSGYQPVNRLAWFGQIVAAVIFVGVLLSTYSKFRFTTFSYMMVFLHLLLLLYGAHFTYSDNPLFDRLQAMFGWQRNYFDRLGHFFQGLVPAFLVKEFLLRAGHLKKGWVLRIVVMMVCLGFSALYELSEFALVFMLDVPVDAVMGTQGDRFDSYWDMVMALIGALVAIFPCGPFHDQQIEKNEDFKNREGDDYDTL